jgi:maltose O-acetyltransferase
MSPEPASSPSASRVSGWHRRRLRLALVRFLLGAFPPFTFNLTRRLALRACGIRPGRGTFFWGLPRVTGPGSIASRLRIGTRCGFNDGCLFELDAPVTIGNHVSVGHEVRFLTASGPDGQRIAAPISVGDGVWLGARSTLLAGVTVGAGSVIGAGVTVSGDVPPNTLITGAKPVSLAKWR